MLPNGHEEMTPPAGAQYREDPVIRHLKKINRFAVRFLAVLMSLVIIWSVVDVVRMMVSVLLTEPIGMIGINDLLTVFGAFMAVLIAIEIFVNIAIYLQENVIHVKIVMATALMAIARKVIIMDVEQKDPLMILAIAAVVVAMGISYYLVVVQDRRHDDHDHHQVIERIQSLIPLQQPPRAD
jgi:uncharacterized membrane protein (DUF373 family)